MIRSHFTRGVSEKGDMQKAVSKGWCKEGRDPALITVRRVEILPSLE